MTFLLGAVLFLLGGFFGMLIMAFALSVRDNLQKESYPMLKVVETNE